MAPAVVVLGQNSVVIGRQITNIFAGATLYGLAARTTDVDVTFTDFGETIRLLFTEGRPLIGICAAGILIRTLAPMLVDKAQEPPVLAVAEDGSAVVPLLGGLSGVNDLARYIAETLAVKAAITTTGDLRFQTALLSPPPGYHLANPAEAKKFIADLLAGAKVKLQGNAPWLSNSQLPIDPDGDLTIQITERVLSPTVDCLVYHPQTVAIAFNEITGREKEAIALIKQLLADAQISPLSVAGIFAPLSVAANPTIHAVAESFGVPARFFDAPYLARLKSQGYNIASAAALVATGSSGKLIFPTGASVLSSPLAIAIANQIIDPDTKGQARGRLAIIGIGPGGEQWMSPQVKEILKSATDLVGYKTYLDLLGTLGDGKQRHESDNRQEEKRAIMALDLAAQGRYVAVVSSGDPGIYAMASAVFDALEHHIRLEWQTIEIQVAPGISAMQALAATIGAPLGHDFCVISLSDILKPWTIIEQRIQAAAQADFVIAFYNPASKERNWQLTAAKNILLQHKRPDTLVVLGRNMGRENQTVKVTTLEEFVPSDADMRTTIIVGSTLTRKIPWNGGDVWIYTPRRYH